MSEPKARMRIESHRCSQDCGPECLPCEDVKALARSLTAAEARADALQRELDAIERVLPNDPRRGVELLDKVTALVVQHQHDNGRCATWEKEAAECRSLVTLWMRMYDDEKQRADALQRELTDAKTDFDGVSDGLAESLAEQKQRADALAAELAALRAGQACATCNQWVKRSDEPRGLCRKLSALPNTHVRTPPEFGCALHEALPPPPGSEDRT